MINKQIFINLFLFINLNINCIILDNLLCAEILYEAQWSRIISGDQAARLTREISEETEQTSVSSATIKAILSTLRQPMPDEPQLNAWREALKRYGWAQQENEPEYQSYRATQIIVVAGVQPELLVRQYGLPGKILEVTFALNGEKMVYEQIEIPESLDRTVFNTVRSPAYFVLNQEHFQKHFFEGMLNLDYPGLETAKKAYEEKKILLAAHEVAEYFRRKHSPVWPAKQPQKTAQIDDEAERVLRHEFLYHNQTIKFGDRLDWYNNPVDNSEWLWYLNRMYHWVTLLNGYLKTANEAYAREYNCEVIDWVVRNPTPSFRLTRVPSWRNLEAGVRMATTWPQTFYGFLSSASLQTHTIQLMLASIWSHGKHIARFPSGMRFVNNWVITESSGLAIAGMNFPEFKDAEKWTEIGFQRLSEQLAKQVYPDGVQHELATSYHISCLNSFQNAFEVAQQTDNTIPLRYAEILEKMYYYLMYVCTPSRETPPTNDANRNKVIRWLELGAEQFKRPDMRYVATNGEQGQVPRYTSYFFDWGGHAIMRSDWSDEAWYLFFDVGPSGVSHQHEDKLHIGVSAFGRDFLTDGGKGTYIPDKWRDYFVSTASHNTIMIDGMGQHRIASTETHRAEKAQAGKWLSDEKIDFACGSYTRGYGTQRIPVNHSRYVVFKKQEYWLVLDYLQGKGQHQFDALYHFTPCEVAVDTANYTVNTLHEDGKNLLLAANATTPIILKIIKGQENPEQGWISGSGAQRLAVPTAVFQGKAELPVVLATVMQPFSGTKSGKFNITFEQSPEFQVIVNVRNDFGDDCWIINLGNKNRVLVDGNHEKCRLVFRRQKGATVIDEIKRSF